MENVKTFSYHQMSSRWTKEFGKFRLHFGRRRSR